MFGLKIEENRIVIECKNRKILRILRRMLNALDDLRFVIEEISKENEGN